MPLLFLALYSQGFDGDPYKVLNVGRKATQAQIKTAYREKARETHPDKNPADREGAEDRFRDVAAAYEILSDDNARRDYDRHGHRPKGRGGQQQQQQRGGFHHFHHHQQHSDFHRRAWEQHQRTQQEHQRRRQETLMNAKYRKAQERVSAGRAMSTMEHGCVWTLTDFTFKPPPLSPTRIDTVLSRPWYTPGALGELAEPPPQRGNRRRDRQGRQALPARALRPRRQVRHHAQRRPQVPLSLRAQQRRG